MLAGLVIKDEKKWENNLFDLTRVRVETKWLTKKSDIFTKTQKWVELTALVSWWCFIVLM
jgi:hypothetical protein